jgi:hypothetical protein
MSPEGRYRSKFLLIVLLLFATLCAQTNSFASEEETHTGSQHCCRLCHMGPVPILTASSVAVVAPIFAAVWILPYRAIAAPREVLLPAAPSRAPPA